MVECSARQGQTRVAFYIVDSSAVVCYAMAMSNANWIFKNGASSVDCTSFPYAFRAMWNTIKKGVTDKKPVDTSTLTILGPKNGRGERTAYSYFQARKLAEDQGLLTAEEQINSREFKRR